MPHAAPPDLSLRVIVRMPLDGGIAKRPFALKVQKPP